MEKALVSWVIDRYRGSWSIGSDAFKIGKLYSKDTSPGLLIFRHWYIGKINECNSFC